MQYRLALVVCIILLFGSIVYSEEFSYSQSYGSHGYNYNDDINSEEFDEDFDFEDDEDDYEEKEFPSDFKGLGGCSSPKECVEYCKEHEDECRRMMENKYEMLG